ncbi:hypothetical protein CHELA1G11_11125 [Hyphomicrobiales bacterium]|nr:hypothetical protein CHELA1G11_11125 [Hyphomicrobiales bacterium]
MGLVLRREKAADVIRGAFPIGSTEAHCRAGLALPPAFVTFAARCR